MRKIFGIVCVIAGIAIAVTTINKQPAGSSADKSDALKRGSPSVVLIAIGIRLLLSGGGGGSISLSFPKRAGNANPASDARWRGAQDTTASNPARLELNYLQWLAAHPAHIGMFSAFAFAGLLLLTVKWQAGLVVLAAAIITFWRSRQEMRRKFFMGDVCPGVVISARQGLVAVWTDLKAAANIPRPAIKILRQPLGRIKIYQLQDGMRVASVAEYYGQAQETAWKNFFPEVIPSIVHDETENQRILDSIPEETWQALDAGLARIPAANPGLYRLWGNTLESDVSASVPWLQRKWVRIGLIAFACTGIGFIALGVWANSRRNKRELLAQNEQSHPARTPTTNPLPAHQQSRDLSGRTVTFTNLMGEVLNSVALVRANQSLLTYQNQGAEKSMALALVPVEIQDRLEIPPEWHGYRAAQSRAGFPAPPASTPNPTSHYQPGQKVYARWAGSWVAGTVLEPFGRIGASYRIQLDDPRFRQPLVLSTNLLSPR